MEFNIALLPGDYVGPEVIAEAVKVIDVVGSRYGHMFNWQHDAIGGASIDKYGEPLREETIDLCRRSHAVFFGAVGGPKWDRPDQKNPADTAILRLRKTFDLYANLRFVKVFPSLANASTLKPEVVREVDLVILRELTSGLYFGEPRGITYGPLGTHATNTMTYTEAEIERILRVGFLLARRRSKRLLSVDKSNVLEVSFLWRQTATRLANDYPDIELTHMYVDAAAMLLIRDPKSLDVVVMENTFGDILSDEASMIAGSLGMIPSASLAGLSGEMAFGIYEPIHGTDPVRARKDVDNPIASILSGALMLRYSLGLEDEASAIERAVENVLARGYRTWDIMDQRATEVGTCKMGDLIAQALEDGE